MRVQRFGRQGQVRVKQMVVFFKYLNNAIVLIDTHPCHNEISVNLFFGETDFMEVPKICKILKIYGP